VLPHIWYFLGGAGVAGGPGGGGPGPDVLASAAKSDRAALDAIAALLRATRKFDKVLVGKSWETTPKPAKWGVLAHLELREDARSRPDQSPLMTLNEGAYLLTIALRGGRDDKADADRIDRLKRVALNAAMGEGTRAYGGFCLPRFSRLDSRGRLRQQDIGLVLQIPGSFAYWVDMSDIGYSESA
jgi:hypothetical protein